MCLYFKYDFFFFLNKAKIVIHSVFAPDRPELIEVVLGKAINILLISYQVIPLAS